MCTQSALVPCRVFAGEKGAFLIGEHGGIWARMRFMRSTRHSNKNSSIITTPHTFTDMYARTTTTIIPSSAAGIRILPPVIIVCRIFRVSRERQRERKRMIHLLGCKLPSAPTSSSTATGSPSLAAQVQGPACPMPPCPRRCQSMGA